MPTRLTSSSEGVVYAYTSAEADELYDLLPENSNGLRLRGLLNTQSIAVPADPEIGAPIPGVPLATSRRFNGGAWLRRADYDSILGFGDAEAIAADTDAVLDELTEGMVSTGDGGVEYVNAAAWMAANAGATGGQVTAGDPLPELEVADQEAFDDLLNELAGGATPQDVAAMAPEARETALETAMALGIVVESGAADWKRIAIGFGVTLGVVGLFYLGWKATR